MSGISLLSRKMKILLVDDQPLIRAYVKAGLCDFAEACHVGADHEDFMRLIGREKYDIVILDHALPQVSGLEVLYGIRSGEFACPYDTRVVMITGYSDFSLATQAKKFDVDNLIVKPFSISTLIQKISGATQRPSAKEDITYYKDCLRQIVEDVRVLKRLPAGVVLPNKPLWYTAMELEKATRQSEPIRVDILNLQPGMCLAENVYSPNGQLLAGEGVELTERIIQRLRVVFAEIGREWVLILNQ